MSNRAPKGEVVRNPVRGGYTFALRFTAYGKRRYVTLGRPADGWNEAKAQTALEDVLADVRRGIWQAQAPPAEEPAPEPTFHEFASAWFEQIEGELRPNTVLAYEWELVYHLLPFFKDHLLSQITVAEVDRYREAKVVQNRAIEAAAKSGKPRMVEYTDKLGKRYKRAERPLSAVSINKTITRLGQILEVAVERELLPRNPAKVGGRRRRLKTSRPDRIYLDRAEQIAALLDAAGRIDSKARPDHRLHRRAMLATLTFAGLRISELLDLEWRDVDLAVGRLRVRASKTDAGVRYVDLLPVLRDELATLKASGLSGVLVFPSAAGTRQDRNRVRSRVLGRRDQERQRAARQGRPDPAPRGAHAARATAHVRVGARGAPQGPPLRGGSDGPHRPGHHVRDLHAGDARGRPRASTLARGGQLSGSSWQWLGD
jgi:integrase